MSKPTRSKNTSNPRRLLSKNASRILRHLLGKPPNWQPLMIAMERHLRLTKGAVQKGVKELEQRGFIARRKRKGKDGRMTGFFWVFDKTPMTRETIEKKFAEKAAQSPCTLLRTT